MNARNTGSGTTSVLIGPWRKRFRSSRAHVGSCSMWTLLDVDLVSGDICVAVRLKPASIVTITANSRSCGGCMADGLAISVRDINADQTRCAFGCRHPNDPTAARIEVLLTPPIHFQFRCA